MDPGMRDEFSANDQDSHILKTHQRNQGKKIDILKAGC
jgi:hypothetical protein